jgi:DNA-binding response OmpR family regulator
MLTILLVDTPEGDASLLASALRVEGFDAQIATSAAEARSVLASGTVALTIVDLMLRGTHGLELARELKTAHPTMRVLLTSAYHLSERQLERADCGVSGFIPKPYDVAEVVDFIRCKLSGPPSSRRMWQVESASGVVERTDVEAAHANVNVNAGRTRG